MNFSPFTFNNEIVEIQQWLLKTSKKLKAKGPHVHISNMYELSFILHIPYVHH